MSNSELSATGLQGILGMCGLYTVSIRMEKRFRSRFGDAFFQVSPRRLGLACSHRIQPMRNLRHLPRGSKS
jgi:hypothetical protein